MMHLLQCSESVTSTLNIRCIKCDNGFNNGGLSEHRIYREQDGIPSLLEALMEFSLTERLVLGRTG